MIIEVKAKWCWQLWSNLSSYKVVYNCLSCFTTAKITFTSILYSQYIYIYIWFISYARPWLRRCLPQGHVPLLSTFRWVTSSDHWMLCERCHMHLSSRCQSHPRDWKQNCTGFQSCLSVYWPGKWIKRKDRSQLELRSVSEPQRGLTMLF